MSEKPTFNPGGATRTEEQPSIRQPQPARAITGNATASLGDLTRLTAVGNRGSKTPYEVKELFDKVAARVQKNPNSKNIFSVVIEDHQLNIPAIAFYSIDSGSIYVYPMLIEELGKKLIPVMEQGPNNRQIEIDMPTARYYDPVMQDITEAAVLYHAQEAGLVKQAKVVTVASVVIPSSVKLDDEDKLAPFYDSAVAALAAQIHIVNGETTSQITSALLTNQALQVVARNQIRPGSTSQTAYGEIIAHDFQIDLVARNAVRNQNDLHNTGNEYVLSSVMGYVDFAFRPASPQEAMEAKMRGQGVPQYDPYIVITNASPLGLGAATNDDILSQCFAITSIAGLATGNRWTSVFTRAAGDSGKKTSVGAFGLEYTPNDQAPHVSAMIPVSAGFDVQSGSDVKSPLQVLNAYCHNTMQIAMDIVQGGPMSWVQAVFANAVPGSIQEARINEELNAFSNGAWSKIWNGSQPITILSPVEIHLGHCTEQDGTVRDIRSLDYLHMLQATNADAQIMIPYSEGFYPGNCDKVAMDKKRKIIQNYASNVVFTGIANN